MLYTYLVRISIESQPTEPTSAEVIVQGENIGEALSKYLNVISNDVEVKRIDIRKVNGMLLSATSISKD